MASIGLIAAGDVVYKGIHPYLGESGAQTRLQWIEALDKLDTLNPRAVVAGHKIPGNDDGPTAITQTRDYLRDFIRLDEATDTPRQLFDAMIELYPDRANPDRSGAAPTLRSVRPERQPRHHGTNSTKGWRRSVR